MFSARGLLASVSCPRQPDCARSTFCPFSHSAAAPAVPVVATPAPLQRKRPLELAATLAASQPPSEPPTRRSKSTSATPKPVPVPVSVQPHFATGAPVLRVNAAQSLVALPVRQTMLKNLYDHFLVLYENILSSHPTLATEHALRQEEQVYKNSTKLTYRNAVISAIASIKKRPIPTAISHPSVGTDQDIAVRIEARNKLDALRLSRSLLAHLVMSTDTMQHWNYITEIPSGEGGSKPHALGQIVKCERCRTSYKVTDTPANDECTYHWGKPFNKTINGEKLRIYSCCSKTTTEDGCSRGCHVFHEADPVDLHLRHSFSFTRLPKPYDGNHTIDTAFDVVALDCEMIYTTGGMRVARVSVVDGAGSQIFDEHVCMDDGVDIIDYNTRFSGITKENHQNASLTLPLIRQSLDAFINSETIIIGHALENDLKTLRMIHRHCIDTVVLFPHRAGRPYRRSLRDLAKEHLGMSIQTGDGSIGHSSVEDSVATLDLVRWHILNKAKDKATAPTS